MESLEQKIRRLVRIMYYIAGAAIMGMMFLTVLDVALRFAVTLNAEYGWTFLEDVKPFPGTYELVALLATVAAAFAMAHTSVMGGHVAVSIVVRLFPEKTAAVFRIFTNLAGFTLFALLFWRSIAYAQQLQRTGEVSMTMQIPISPFVYGLAFSSLMVCAVLFLEIYDDAIKVRAK